MQNTITTIKKITNSKYLDSIGVFLVVVVSIYLEYYKTNKSIPIDTSFLIINVENPLLCIDLIKNKDGM